MWIEELLVENGEGFYNSNSQNTNNFHLKKFQKKNTMKQLASGLLELIQWKLLFLKEKTQLCYTIHD